MADHEGRVPAQLPVLGPGRLPEQDRRPAATSSRSDARPLSETGISDAVVWALLDVAPDGLLVVDGDGVVLLVNRRMEEMFGHDRAELLGQSVEVLLPDALRLAHRQHRAAYVRAPRVRPMGLGIGLVGRRRDGSQLPVEISLSPLTTAQGRWVIAAVRDTTQRQAAAADRLAEQIAAAEFQVGQELMDGVIRGLFGAGLKLQGVLPRVTNADVAARVGEALEEVDLAIRSMRRVIFDLGDAITGGERRPGDQ